MTSDMTAVSLACQLIAFDTVNPPGNERECAHFVGGLLERAGFQTRFFEFADKRTTLIARLEGSEDAAALCFSGHLDTVPLGAAPWTQDPFGEIVDGRLYGRGSSDMKAAVAAMVVMARKLATRPERRAELTLIITAGEETCCQGGHHVAGLGPDAIGKVNAIVVGEPTSNRPVVAHKGSVRFSIRAKGKTAHASMPEQGINAIYRAAKVIEALRLFDFEMPSHPLLGAPTLNVGTITGGMNINSVPDAATIGVDIRTIPGQNEAELIRRLQSTLGDDIDVERVEGACSIETDASDPWVRTVFDILMPILGERPQPAGVPYFTDASALTPALGNPPTLLLGPGEAAMAHKTDEYCLISRIDQAVEIYTTIATRWCAGE